MHTLPWHKFYTDKFLVKMHTFPHHILGKWIRVFCTMAESKDRWTVEGDLEKWSRIIGEQRTVTKQFIEYIMDHFTDVKVEINVVDNRPVYTLTETLYKSREANRPIIKKGVPYSRRNALSLNRKEMIQRILLEYHPEKLLGRNSTFKKEFLKIMQDSSRGIKKIDDRITAEKDTCQKILNYIKGLATTPEWKEPKFLPTLNDFILTKAWESNSEIIPKMKKRLADILIDEA